MFSKEENWRTWRKNLFAALQAKNDPLMNKLEYKDNQKDPSCLIYSKSLSPPSSSYQQTSPNLVFTSFPDLAIPPDCTAKPHQLDLAKIQCFAISKTTLYTLNGCGLCLGKISFQGIIMGEGRIRDYKGILT